MSDTSRDPLRISLEGDWSMGGVPRQYALIGQRIEQMRGGDDRPQGCELDLAGITELDACGCQLLASFARQLRGAGVPARCSGLSEAFDRKIRLLGFAADLGLQPSLSGEGL